MTDLDKRAHDAIEARYHRMGQGPDQWVLGYLEEAYKMGFSDAAMMDDPEYEKLREKAWKYDQLCK